MIYEDKNNEYYSSNTIASHSFKKKVWYYLKYQSSDWLTDRLID